MNENEIYTAILSGQFDAGLDRIMNAVQERRKMVGDINAVRLKVGDRVRLHSLSERTLNNQVGIIKRTPSGRSKRFDIELDNDVVSRGRVTKDIGGVPAQCVTAI